MINHESEVLEVCATRRRNHGAPRKFLRRAMNRYSRPKVIVPECRWFEDYAVCCAHVGIEAASHTPANYSLPSGRALLLGWATGESEFLKRRPLRTCDPATQYEKLILY